MSVWDEVFARCYETVLWPAERAGLAERRRKLVSRARGRVLEIGPGPGNNLRYFPDDLGELVLAEPVEGVARVLEKRVAKAGRAARVVRAPAESLPFEDDSFDTVLAIYVLCTVTDPEQALAEVARVLKPGGELLFIEHVRSREPRLARWQDRLHGLWLRFGNGCNCNRETWKTLQASDLEVKDIEFADQRFAMPLVKPLIQGYAAAP